MKHLTSISSILLAAAVFAAFTIVSLPFACRLPRFPQNPYVLPPVSNLQRTGHFRSIQSSA